jgi:hypothetical protein
MVFEGLKFVIPPDGFDDEELRLVTRIDQVTRNGGQVLNAYSASCTHVLVVERTCPAVVKQAKRDGKHIVTDHWLEACLKQRTIMPVAIPDFEGLLVCLTGYPQDLRAELIDMVWAAGAHYTGRLVKNVTHLIAYDLSGPKFDYTTKQPHQAVVNHLWLQDSLEDWHHKAEERYRLLLGLYTQWKRGSGPVVTCCYWTFRRCPVTRASCVG